VLQSYHLNTDGSAGMVRLLFGTIAALTGLAQWIFFRRQLKFWWVLANAVVGLGLGVLHKALFDSTGWGLENLLILLVAWIIVNSVIGLILLRGAQGNSRDGSPIIEAGARQSIFILFLSISLIVAAFSNAALFFQQYDYIQTFLILYGISALLVGLSFFWRKEVPRNFGFIALTVFFLFDGINVERVAFNSDYPPYYFILNGTMALVAGVFFLSHRETWKNFGFSTASVSLFLTGWAGLAAYDTSISYVLLIISSLFAVPAAVYFILRK